MNCESFDRWLDDGRLEGVAAEARAHARECRRCGGALEALLEVEAALVSAPTAPAGFTDRVMARVAASPQPRASRARAALLADPAMPWWTRAAMDPAVVLAAGLAALVAGWGATLVAKLQAWLAGGARLPFAIEPAGDWRLLLADPRVLLAMAIAMAPSMIWLGRGLYTWSEGLVSRRGSAVRTGTI